MGTQLVSPTKVRTNDMSASVAAAAVGAGLSLTGGLFSNRTNRQIAEQNMALQREANAQNIALTREINNQNIAFQQRENDITRMREDNAVQRAAADMTAAGLSKTLAAGNPASASALSAPQASTPQVSPIQNSFKYESALQKMNIANFMLDMATKNEQLKQSKSLNDAQIANIQANTDNTKLQNSVFMDQYNNKKLLMDSEIAYNYAREESEKASARLTNLLGDYKGYEVEAEIALKVKQSLYYQSEIDLNNKSLEKMAADIAHSVADSNYLNKKAEQAVYELSLTRLKIKELEHNISVAQKYGYPVGYMPSGIFGSGFSTGVGLGGLLNFTFDKGSSDPLNLFNEPSDLYKGMGQNVGTYLPHYI